MEIRKIAAIAAAALLGLAGCSPQTTTVYLQMRSPSASGLNLSGKTLAIVYPRTGVPADSAFCVNASSALARALEEDYFSGEEIIGIYETDPDSLGLGKMRNLVMDTGSDVVFLLNTPMFGDVTLGQNVRNSGVVSTDSLYAWTSRVPVAFSIDLYDSMEKEEKVHTYNGNASLRPVVYNDGRLQSSDVLPLAMQQIGESSQSVGKKISEAFVSGWEMTNVSLYYYDYLDDNWIEAVENAYGMDWKGAIDKWLKLVESGGNNPERMACASYNLASAFYVLGNYPLAKQWLEHAENSFPGLSLIPGLKSRIAAKLPLE